MGTKPGKYDRTKSVKAISRKRVGPVPKTRPLDERAVRDKPKHKKPIVEGEE